MRREMAGLPAPVRAVSGTTPLPLLAAAAHAGHSRRFQGSVAGRAPHHMLPAYHDGGRGAVEAQGAA